MVTLYFKIGLVVAASLTILRLIFTEHQECSYDDFYKGTMRLFEDTFLEKIVKLSITKRICYISVLAVDAVGDILIWPIRVVAEIIFITKNW